MTFMANIPVPSVTVGTVSGTSVSMQWASDGYATWHRVEYTVQGNKRSSTPVVVAAMQSGNGMTVTGLATGTNYTFHVYSGQVPLIMNLMEPRFLWKLLGVMRVKMRQD